MNFVLSAITAFILAFNSSWNTGVHNVVNFALGNHRNISSNSLTREPVNSDPNVLGASTSTPDSNDNVTFNLDAIFNKNLTAKQGITIQGDSIFNTLKANSINLGNGTITAANILYGVKSGTGISIGDGQSPTITNTGVTSLGGSTGSLSLAAGTGISVSGLTVTNSDLGSSQYIFKNIAVSGQNTIAAGSNSDTLTFVAGTGVALTTDSTNKKLTISSNNPNIAAGWTNIGSNVYLTTSSDYVGIGTSSPTSALNVVGTSTLSGPVTLGSSASDALTFMGRIANGTSLLPNTDLGSDLGASDKRFNNLWVANINSNSSQSFSGQTTFSYPPTDTTIAQASVLINPTTSAANGQLLGLALAGYQKALIDAEGDIILGYNGATSAPATNYPLTIYGHNATNVAYVDTSGNLTLANGAMIKPIADSTTALKIANAAGTPFATFDSTGNGNIVMKSGSSINWGGGWTTITQSTLRVNNTMLGANGNTSIGGTGGYAGGYINLQNLASESFSFNSYNNSTNQNIFLFNAKPNDTTENLMQIQKSGSAVLTVNNSGNVGIGTSNPANILDVAKSTTGAIASITSTNSPSGGDIAVGELRFRSTGVSTGGNDIAGIGMVMNTTNTINLGALTFNVKEAASATSMTEAMRINANGYVGIGTTNPTYPLYVNGTGYFYGSSIGNVNVTVGGRSNTISMTAQTGPANATIVSGYGGLELDTTQNGNIALMPNGTGNIGIGTTNPSSKLTVNDGSYNMYFNSSYGLDISGALLRLGQAKIQGFNNSGLYVDRQTSGGGAARAGMFMSQMGYSTWQTVPAFIFTTTASTPNFQSWYATDDTENPKITVTDLAQTSGLSFGFNSNTHGIIKGHGLAADLSVALPTYFTSGNVGIGTTSPGQKLEIQSADNTQTNGLAVYTANRLQALQIGPGVIQATMVGLPLAIQAASGSSLSLLGGWNNALNLQIRNQGYIDISRSGDIGSLEIARIDYNGNVGIGTTSPLAGLDVEKGNGGNPAMIVNNPLGGDIFTASASGSTKFVIANNGNVGIGTSNPTNQVHISGAPSSGYNLYVQSTWGGSNIPIADFVADSNVPLSIWKDYTKFYGNTLYVGGSTNSGLVGIGTTNPGALLQISNTGAVGQIGQIIKGVINQSGDLQQWQSSSGLVLTSVSSGGDLLLRKATSTSSNINFYALNGSGSDQLSASLIAGGTGTGFAGGLDSQFIVQLSGSNALSLIESGGGSRNLTASLQPAASSGTLAFQLIANSSQTTATPILQIEDSTNANVMTANHLGDLYLLNNLNTPNGGLGQYANLLTYSQQFDNAAWTKSNVTVTPNSTTSPIGDTTGAYISINSGACQGGSIYQSTATAAGSGTFTASIYIKGTGTAFGVNLKIDNDSGTNQSASTSLNLTSSSSTWQRIQVSKTFSSATGNVRLTLSGGGCGTFPFYAWGSQIEQDTSAGPYVNVAANTVNSNSGMVLNNTLRFSNVTTSIVTGTNENFTIIPGGTGNVGIGTTSPNGALDVRASTTRPDSGWGTLSLVSNNAVAADKGGVLDFGGIYNGSGALANWAGIAGLKNDGTDGTYGGYLSFYTRSNSTANIERMRIDMNGNVGIGTTSPSYLLDVNGTARANGLYVNGSGTVGTLGPSGATDGYIYFGQTGRLGTNIYNGGSYYTNTYAHLFQGGNVVISGGLLGIGTTAPLAGLDVEKGNGGNPAMIVNNPLGGDIIDASSSGVMKFSIANHGLVNATSGGLATFTKAGTISDTDFTDTAVNGLIGFDSTDGRLYIRNAGAWSYIAKTAGFQIPSFESAGFAPGDLLQPYVEKIMSDGAVHGLYKKLDINELINSDALTFKTNVEFQGPAVFKALAEFFNNVIFHGNVSFDQAPMMSKNTAGTAIISTYSDHVDVVFDSPYPKTPIVTFNLVNSSTDQTFIADGQQAYLENVTNKGFTIKLPNMAVKDFSYNWMAFATNGDSITKSTSVIQDILGAQATATPSAQPSPTPLRPTGFEGQAPVASATPTTTPTVATATPSATLEITPVASATPTVAP